MIKKFFLGAIAAGFFILAWVLMITGPKTEPKKASRPLRTVTVESVKPGNHKIAVTAYGTVIPAKRVSITPQVTGPIVSLHPSLVPGGRVKKGDVLFTIDRTLANLDLLEAEASLKRTKALLDEAKRQLSEARELSETRVIADTELATLESNHKIQIAEHQRLVASRDKTNELLRRHDVVAPFNSFVLDVDVAIGQRVSPPIQSATLINTDIFWVKVSLPLDQLRWIKLPNKERLGASVDIFVDEGARGSTKYQGHVIQLLGDVEEMGRMARLLVEIKNPLGKNNSTSKTPLLIGNYVRVEVNAGTFDNVLAIDRNSLREGDKIWIVDENDELHIREAQIRWKQGETILIENILKPSERLIVSSLRVALPGMKVKPRILPQSKSSSE